MKLFGQHKLRCAVKSKDVALGWIEKIQEDQQEQLKNSR